MLSCRELTDNMYFGFIDFRRTPAERDVKVLHPAETAANHGFNNKVLLLRDSPFYM